MFEAYFRKYLRHLFTQSLPAPAASLAVIRRAADSGRLPARRCRFAVEEIAGSNGLRNSAIKQVKNSAAISSRCARSDLKRILNLWLHLPVIPRKLVWSNDEAEVPNIF